MNIGVAFSNFSAAAVSVFDTIEVSPSPALGSFIIVKSKRAGLHCSPSLTYYVATLSLIFFLCTMVI